MSTLRGCWVSLPTAIRFGCGRCTRFAAGRSCPGLCLFQDCGRLRAIGRSFGRSIARRVIAFASPVRSWV